MAGLSSLFKTPSDDVGFRAGTLTAWNSTSGANTVTVGGTTLTNVPVLITTALPAFTVPEAGLTVHLLRVRNQYFIVGRIVQPPI
jgi:hypothetical protein